MRRLQEKRATELAKHIIETGDTVRAAAKKFSVSKSTVHKDVAERLWEIDHALAEKAEKVLQLNKNERHLRGGEATKIKYKIDKK